MYFSKMISKLNNLKISSSKVDNYFDESIRPFLSNFNMSEDVLKYAFGAELALAEILEDSFYTKRNTDTKDFQNFSWDVLNPRTGARIEVKTVKLNPGDESITFGTSDSTNNRFYYGRFSNNEGVRGSSTGFRQSIHLDNFIDSRSKADVLIVVNFIGIDKGHYCYEILLVIDRELFLSDSSKTLILKSRRANSGCYMQVNCPEISIDSNLSEKVSTPQMKHVKIFS
ncbi:hypothetical protein [Erwinia phage FBB1]|nr:hypothetical protein [Erwinia phage FBB1]